MLLIAPILSFGAFLREERAGPNLAYCSGSNAILCCNFVSWIYTNGKTATEYKELVPIDIKSSIPIDSSEYGELVYIKCEGGGVSIYPSRCAVKYKNPDGSSFVEKFKMGVTTPLIESCSGSLVVPPEYRKKPVTYTLLAPLPEIDSKISADASDYIFGVIKLLIGVAAVLAVIMIVVAGIQYIGSAASPNLKTDAKDRITGALIGLMLLLGSWIILNSIDRKLISRADFKIPEIQTTSTSPP